MKLVQIEQGVKLGGRSQKIRKDAAQEFPGPGFSFCKKKRHVLKEQAGPFRQRQFKKVFLEKDCVT